MGKDSLQEIRTHEPTSTGRVRTHPKQPLKLHAVNLDSAQLQWTRA